MVPARDGLWAGARDVVPVLLGVGSFGVVSGLIAHEVGFTTLEAMMMSIFVYAGSAQIVVARLWSDSAPLLIIFASTLIVNLRYVIFSASVAPRFQSASKPLKLLLSYLLADQTYALMLARYPDSNIDPGKEGISYYLGMSVPFWATWQLANLAGLIIGAAIPPEWGLDLAIPLTFLSLVIPMLTSSPTIAAAVTASIVALLTVGWPFNLGLLAATAVGVGVGMLVSRKAALLVSRESVQ